MVEAFTQYGSLPSFQEQARFYAQLEGLQSDVLAGTHPRITLPAHVIKDLAASRPAAEQSSPVKNVAAVSFKGTAPTELNLSKNDQPILQPSITHKLPPKPPNALQPLDAKPTSSTFDPVLLTKSDQLIKAETALKRQRLERALKSSAETKGLTPARDKDWAGWTGPHLFDASQVLAQANALVKPVSGLHLAIANKPSPKPPAAANKPDSSLPQPNKPNRSSPDSFDENSYYSSRHDSWTPEKNTAPDKNKIDLPSSHIELIEGIESGSVENVATAIPPRVSGLGPPDVLSNGSLTAPPPVTVHGESSRIDDVSQESAEKTNQNSDEQDEDEEMESIRNESYSPPPVEAFHNNTTNKSSNPVNIEDASNSQFNLPGDISEARSRDSESYSPPPPVFTSLQIPYQPQHSFQTSQPDTSQSNNQSKKNSTTRNGAKISKSARKKERLANQSGKKGSQSRAQVSKANSSQAATTSTQEPQVENSRKRRREAATSLGESPRNVVGLSSRPQATSPLPLVKTEPQSPPLAQYPQEPSRRLVLREDGRADIENLSPQNTATQSITIGESRDMITAPRRTSLLADQRFYESESVYDDHQEFLSIPVRRPVPRGGMDLRRMASMQQASRPYSVAASDPRFYDAEETHFNRAQSNVHSPGIRGGQDYLWHNENESRPMSSISMGQRMRDAQNHEYYAFDDPPGRIMAPPPLKRRIIIDEYGNEYIAVPARSASATYRVPEPMEIAPPQQRYVGSQPRQILSQESFYDTQEQGYVVDRQPSVIRRRRPAPQEVIVIDDDDEGEMGEYNSMQQQQRMIQRPPPPPERALPRTRVYSNAPAPSPISGAMPRSIYAPATRSASMQPAAVLGGGTYQAQAQQLSPSFQYGAGVARQAYVQGGGMVRHPSMLRTHNARPQPSPQYPLEMDYVQPMTHMPFDETWR